MGWFERSQWFSFFFLSIFSMEPSGLHMYIIDRFVVLYVMYCTEEISTLPPDSFPDKAQQK